MSEVILSTISHDGVVYPQDTAVADIKGLSGKQAEELRVIGVIGEQVIPESVQNDLDEARKEVEALKAQLAATQKTKEPEKK